MNIGIFVHSKTGNTYSVAQKIMDKLIAAGHKVEILRIEPIGGENTNDPDITKIKFDKLPEVSGYDVLIFGGPVRGMSISPVLSAYLSQLASLKAKKVELLVTQFFPFSWMGGNHTINQMKNVCESKGAVVIATGIVNWKSRLREVRTTEVIDRLSHL